ncbi:MAG: tetratricopeptide repeat protein [Chloroflexi bacterium]|nr:tetratricopeptide repeat protein [Chloroflexota bacterium]
MTKTWRIIGVILALATTVFVLPSAASVWLQNWANAQIARAATSPPGNEALGLARTQLEQARQFANEPRLSLAQARLALAQNDAPGALDALAQADATDFIAPWLRGNAAYQLRQTDLAFAAWRDAGARDYFSNQAHRAFDKHQWELAEHYARLALGVAPEIADLHLLLGEAISRREVNDPEAWRELDRAEALAPNDEFRATVLSRRAEMLAAQNKLGDALALFERAMQIAPIDARPRTGYALTQLRLDARAKPQAVAMLTQVVGDSPWYVAAYLALAQLAENDRGAETWLQRGLDQNPNDARLLLPLGELYARQGRITEARAMLELALKRETRVDNREAIARALEQLK